MIVNLMNSTTIGYTNMGSEQWQQDPSSTDSLSGTCTLIEIYNMYLM